MRRHSRRRRLGTAIGLTAVLLLAACGEDDAPLTTGSTGGDGSTTTVSTAPPGPIPEGAEGLDEARARWEAAGIDDYDLTYRPLCFCPQYDVTVVVRGGEVVSTDSVSDMETSWEPEGLSVDEMFAELEQAVDGDAHEVQATWDEATGRPLRYWIDESEMVADEEHGIEVLTFSPGRPIDEPVEPPDPSSSVPTTGTTQAPGVQAVATAQLTEMWGCGYGFHASDAGQTVGLQLWTDAPPADGATVVLPDPAWDAELQVGERLFANWCTDLPTEPDPQVDETWPVVGGTMVVTVPPGPGLCSRSTATATITGLTVEAPDGGTVTLTDLALTNDGWGCFAG